MSLWEEMRYVHQLRVTEDHGSCALRIAWILNVILMKGVVTTLFYMKGCSRLAEIFVKQG